MSKTVVGLFSSFEQANKVKQTLLSTGYDGNKVTVMANDDSDSGEHSLSTGTDAGSHEGIGQKISNFFSGLTGGDDQEKTHYTTGVQGGGALVAVSVPDEQASYVASLLKQHGARDIDSDNSNAAEAGVPVYGDEFTRTTGQSTAIPVVEEQLVVGKREVDRGGVRVYSHVVEEPVSADVSLREERVNVTRRAVDREATAADFEQGREGVIELTATGEEAVVGKSARVVEEVLVGKDTSQRTEAIHETVRHTEVDVEELDGTVPDSRADRF